MKTIVYWSMWHVVLSYLLPASLYDHLGCRLHGSELHGHVEDGDMLIGAMLPFHSDNYLDRSKILFTEPRQNKPCTFFRYQRFLHFCGMRLALEEINRSPTLLPNLTLGFQVYDSCAGILQELDGTLKMLTGQSQGVPNFSCKKLPQVSSVIGHSTSTFSILNAFVLGLNRFPQVPISLCTQSCVAGFRKVLRKDLPACCFECVLCPLGEISNITDSLNCFSCPWDEWPNSQKDRCFPKNKEFLSFEEPLGVTLASTSSFSSLLPISIFGLFMCYKNTPIVRANNFSLSCLLLMSMSLCFLSSLAFIGYPQPEKCLLRQVAFGTVFTLCVSCILAKTIMVVFAFMATKPGSGLRKWARPRVSYMIIAFSCILQLTLCMSWISFAPPFPTDNIHTKPGIIIVECNEGSPTAFWCMLGYLSLLATISFIVAFLARRLPDSFNEAKFITFSMLAFLSVWVSYIPASLSSTGKYSVAMEVFAILSSSWALMTCMFAPKCFIILLRPEMNTKEHLMGKVKT
ncbi:vomeronasal type-2 receptor 26-like [Pelobates fuscus]|uniref:vomeronasal type-2 receptor 26-like n=1 Tax=Pelobates fuscus TaxID=191477 RepID=UPI002FE4E321